MLYGLVFFTFLTRSPKQAVEAEGADGDHLVLRLGG